MNLAKVATPSSLYTSGDTRNSALKDGFTPANSADNRHGSYGNWPRVDTQWVQYDWSRPVTTDKIDVYWWIDGQGVGAPKSCRVLYWNGSAFVPVTNAVGLGVSGNTFNTTTFDPVQTEKLRLEIVSDGRLSTGILDWKVYSSGPVSGVPALRRGGHRPHRGARRQNLSERQGGVADLPSRRTRSSGARSRGRAR